MNITCIDLYCGIGGLTAGLEASGINVVAGLDIDKSCQWTYEANTKSKFITADISKLTPKELDLYFPENSIKLLAGCAPCQPFSSYGRTRKEEDSRWKLLESFTKAVEVIKPDYVTMENVPGLSSHDIFKDFIRALEENSYSVKWDILKCEDYGVPQKRRRLVLIASKNGEVSLPEPDPELYKTVRDTIGSLPFLKAGQANKKDPIHTAASLSEKNMRRIKHSRPGGTWKDWPESLVADCHKNESGKTYRAVYGRMSWDEPSPTMTTQCYGFGNGRFGHPSQDRAISLREAALLQSFPLNWEFVEKDQKVKFTSIGRAIGNAVPPNLGKAIGKKLIELSQEHFQ